MFNLLFLKIIFSKIKGLIFKNWKIAIYIIILGLIYFLINNALNNAYNKGYTKAELEFKEKVAEENKRNREFEQTLEKVIDDYGLKIVKEAMKRVSKETVFKETLRETIKNNVTYQECVADPQTIEQRNLIRNLGPND